MNQNAFGPRWQVERLDRQVLASLCTAVLRAKLEAQERVDDMRHAEGNVYVEHVKYWEGELDRLTVGHIWLMELLAQS